MRTARTLFFAAACTISLARDGFGADIEQRGLRTVAGGRDDTTFALRDEGEQIRFRFDVRDATPCARPEIRSERELEKFDRVEIYFSPTSDLSRSYYCAEVDPYGHVLDYHVDVPGKFVFDWGFSTIAVRAERSDGGYAVEGSVAKSELRALGVNPDRCWIGVFRADFRTEGDVAGWYSAVPFGSGRPNFHQPKMFFAYSVERAAR